MGLYVEQRRNDVINQMTPVLHGFQPSPELLSSLTLDASGIIFNSPKDASDASLRAQAQKMSESIQKVVASSEYKPIEDKIQQHLTELCHEHNALVKQEVTRTSDWMFGALQENFGPRSK